LNGDSIIKIEKKKKKSIFITKSSQTLVSCNISIMAFLLLVFIAFSMSNFFSLDRDDYTALAFKPTVPSDSASQQQNQPSTQVTEEYIFLKKWGSQGNGPGEFMFPNGIAVDSSRNVYVGDSVSIQKFDSNGNYITEWGSQGYEPGQFAGSDTMYIAIDSLDNVYVVDDGRIQKFDSNGNFITKVGSEGEGDGQFSYPRDIAIDSLDNIYLADSANYRIQVFAPN
jgi:hypothetical protein